MEEDEKEIIYLALCNSVDDYNAILEESSEEEKEMIKYIINRHYELIDKYAIELCKDKPIKRPKW